MVIQPVFDHRRRSGQAERQAQERFIAISQVAAELGSSTSQEMLFSGAGRRLHELGCHSLVLLNPADSHGLRPVYFSVPEFDPTLQTNADWLASRYWTELEAGLRRRDNGLVSRVLEGGEIVFTPQPLAEVAGDLLATGTYRRLFEGGALSWDCICAPLRVAGSVIGMLVVLSEGLEASDGSAVGALASVLGALVQSVRRLEVEQGRRQQMALIHQVATRVNAASPTLRRVIATVEETLVASGRYPHARVGVVAGKQIHFPSSDPGREIRQDTAALGIVSQVVRTAGPMLIHDLRRTRRGWDAVVTPGARSLLAVPMIGGLESDQVTGVVVVESDEVGAFDEVDQVTLEAIAGNLLTAIQNVRLFEHTDRQLARHIAELDTLVKMGLAVTTILDRDVLLTRLTEYTAEALNADHAMLVLVDEDAGELTISHGAGAGLGDVIGKRQPLAGSITEWVVRHGEIVWIADVLRPGWYTPMIDKAMTRQRLRSVLIIPLIQGGRVIGTLFANSSRSGLFSEDDLRTARSISLWATTALENARLYEESREKEESLRRVLLRLGQALASGSDLDMTLNLVFDVSMELMRANAGAVEFLDEEKQYFFVYLTRNLPPAVLATPLPVERSLIGGTVRTGKPVMSDDILNDERIINGRSARMSGMRSLVSVPLRGREGIIGVLTVYRREVQPFSREEATLLQTLADQAVGAIEHARLAQRQGEQARYLDTILRHTREVVVVIGAEGAIEYANQAARGLFEGAVSPFRRRRLASYVAPGERFYVQQMAKRLASGDTSPFEIDVLDNQDVRRHLVVRPAILSPGRRFLLVASDATEEHRLGRMHHEYVRDLHHQLNTPLSSMLELTQLLAEERGMPADKRGTLLQLVFQQGLRIRDLLNELRLYTLLTSPSAPRGASTADLGQAIMRAFAQLRHRHQEVQFVDSLPHDLPRVCWPPDDLQRTLQYLMDRVALQITPGGRIVLDAGVQDGQVWVDVRAEGMTATTEEEIERVLAGDDGVNRGTGGAWEASGLALVRRALMKGDGSIAAHLDPLRGVIFNVRLPAVDPDGNPAGGRV